MKRIMTRSFSVWIFTLLFLAGIIFLGVKIAVGSDEWVQHSMNGHISSAGGLGRAGKILDRDGNILAYSEDGKRYYSEDADTRTALLHVVGDESRNISTAVQSMYNDNLFGYSFFFGLGVPDSLRPNSDVTLTVDSDSCKAAYEAMYGRKGACVVFNYKTGEVLCDISTPSYDPSDPPQITEDNKDDYDGVYLDNVVSSSYTPGSVFRGRGYREHPGYRQQGIHLRGRAGGRGQSHPVRRRSCPR